MKHMESIIERAVQRRKQEYTDVLSIVDRLHSLEALVVTLEVDIQECRSLTDDEREHMLQRITEVMYRHAEL